MVTENVNAERNGVAQVLTPIVWTSNLGSLKILKSEAKPWDMKMFISEKKNSSENC